MLTLAWQNFIIAAEQAASGRPAHLWIYDRKSDNLSGYKLALDRQPNDIVMYDARRQLALDCMYATALLTYVSTLLILLVVIIVVKFEEINLKFKKFVKVQDVIKLEKVRDPHSVTTVIGSHSLVSIL